MTTSSNIWGLPGPRPLTSGQQNVDLFRYSRDGHWLLYASDISGINELYRMPASGGEAEQLTNGSTADNFAPDLSPDGKAIAFHSLRTGTRDIFVLRLDGGPVQQVTATAAQEMIPRWSPDGRTLVYAKFSSQGGIWTVTRDGAGAWSAPHRLSATGAFPDWSPDGRTIVFGASVFGAGGLLVMPASGGPARQILATGGEIQTVEFPKFSEDGHTIVFKSHDREGHINFWSVPLPGGPPQRVARIDDALSASAPYWDMWHGRIAYVGAEMQSDIVVIETIPQGTDGP
jgi:TolB protein